MDALSRLASAEIPGRDLVDLAVRMGRTTAPVAIEVQAPPPSYQVGQKEVFWMHDIVQERYFEVTATLEAATDVVYMWVQDGYPADRAGLEQGAQEFSTRIYPDLRAVFGSEWTPGVDKDPHLHVLHHQPIRGVAGYYSSSDEFTVAVEPHSNEREMFYVNTSLYQPGSFDYLSLLSHEFQHMIHWHSDQDEPVWSNEGLSELATTVAGYATSNANAFFASPDNALMEWDVDPAENAGDYAAAYAFFTFLKAQAGDDAIRAVVGATANGPAGVEQALNEVGRPQAFDDLFLDWVVANVEDDPAFAGGRFSYRELPMGPARAENLYLGETPNAVEPYGTDYYDATTAVSGGALHLAFAGDPAVALLESGSSGTGPVWWSGRGDSGDSRLTREFDLSGASNPRLSFRLWHELEPNWDYAYFLVSADGGASWQRLPTSRTTDVDPNGNNFGSGLTGYSLGWVDEQLDLSPFAGQRVLVRFEVVTDDAVSLTGVAVDDLRLEAAGFHDDASTDAGWLAEGWRRLPPVLPQRWALQVIVRDASGILWVERPEVDPTGKLQLVVEDVPPEAAVIVAVSSLTRGTRLGGAYTLAPVALEDA
jgi:hypothetical protein